MKHQNILQQHLPWLTPMTRCLSKNIEEPGTLSFHSHSNTQVLKNLILVTPYVFMRTTTLCFLTGAALQNNQNISQIHIVERYLTGCRSKRRRRKQTNKAWQSCLTSLRSFVNFCRNRSFRNNVYAVLLSLSLVPAVCRFFVFVNRTRATRRFGHVIVTVVPTVGELVAPSICDHVSRGSVRAIF